MYIQSRMFSFSFLHPVIIRASLHGIKFNQAYIIKLQFPMTHPVYHTLTFQYSYKSYCCQYHTDSITQCLHIYMFKVNVYACHHLSESETVDSKTYF